MSKTKKLFLKTVGILSLVIILFNNYVYATDVVSEVTGGGDIQNSKLGQGIFNIIRDFTGTLQWLLPVIGVFMGIYYVFKIMTGDEQDQQRYKKAIIKVGVCIIGGLIAVTIVNLIAKYFI